MEAKFFVKYDSASKYDDSSVALHDFGESLVAFDTLVKDFGQMFRIQAEIEIYASSHREGSHIVDLIFRVHESFDSLPIDSVGHLLEFLKITGEQLFENASRFFGGIKDLHKTVNDFGAKYPIDIALICLIIPWLFKITRKQRKNELPADPKLSERIAKELYKIIQKNRFGHFINPIVNETAKSIEVSPDRNFIKNTTKIDNTNFEDYLGTDTEILPELIDGNKYDLRGEITSLKSTRGDSLTFQYSKKDKAYNLDLLPPSGETTKSYTQYYKELVNISALVERHSVFKKPKLHLLDISLTQYPLDFKNSKSLNNKEPEPLKR